MLQFSHPRRVAVQLKKLWEFRSFPYNQSDLDLDKKSGPNGRRCLIRSTIGDIPIRLHRNLPDGAVIREVTIKKELNDSNRRSVGWLDVAEERERREREQQSLARKQYDSDNWDRHRKRVATDRSLSIDPSRRVSVQMLVLPDVVGLHSEPTRCTLIKEDD